MINIASRLIMNAERFPDRVAVSFPHKKFFKEEFNYESMSFNELNQFSDKFARYCINKGIRSGDKVLLFIKPCIEFSAVVFGLFKLGAVPVLIDPGMGKKNLLKAISHTEPSAMIVENKIGFIRHLYSETFQSIKTVIKKYEFRKLKNEIHQSFKIKLKDENDLAAILFTSGGTGIPKGVEYSHKIFCAQTDLLKKVFGLTEQDIDVPGFPLFSLFTLAMGMKSCTPYMNPACPSKVIPSLLIKNIIDQNATFAAGSPAIWGKIADYCIDNNIKMPSLKYLVMFGAPVSNELHLKFKKILPLGTTYTPYGATECLPVTNISGEYLIKNTLDKTKNGLGTCVGKAVPGVNIKIIQICDEIVPGIRELPRGEVGEIIVSGSVVTKAYLDMPEETNRSKIVEDEKIWHRMGDLGYFDEEENLWFCGRKSHRIHPANTDMYSIPCEAIFNNHEEVERSALIELEENGKKYPAIVIERKDKKVNFSKKTNFEIELTKMAKNFNHTKEIEKIYYLKDFPVDVRHNIKIDRLKIRDHFLRTKRGKK